MAGIKYKRLESASASLPMPFRIYSTGEKVLTENETERSQDMKNPFVELIWGISGIGEVTLYGEVFQIRENDVFYYLPGEPHFFRSLSPEWKSRWLCFDGPFAEAVMLSYRYPRLQSSCTFPEDLFRRIDQGICDTDPIQIRTMAGLILEVLARAGSSSGHGVHSGLIVKSCIELIKSNLANPELDVSMLCGLLRVHRSTLTKLFSERIGRTPGRCILDYRFELAKTLLRGSNLPISEVATRCGFTSLGSFSRFIRRGTGLSPLAYRKEKQ